MSPSEKNAEVCKAYNLAKVSSDSCILVLKRNFFGVSSKSRCYNLFHLKKTAGIWPCTWREHKLRNELWRWKVVQHMYLTYQSYLFCNLILQYLTFISFFKCLNSKFERKMYIYLGCAWSFIYCPWLHSNSFN